MSCYSKWTASPNRRGASAYPPRQTQSPSVVHMSGWSGFITRGGCAVNRLLARLLVMEAILLLRVAAAISPRALRAASLRSSAETIRLLLR